MAEEKKLSEQTEKVSDQIESNNQESKTEDRVSYDTYRRVLSEKKKMQDRLDILEKQMKERTETELKEKEKWQEYAKLKEKEALELKEKLEFKNKQEIDMIKMSSFLDSIDGYIPKEYWPLIDLEQIVVDPNTNMPDPLSIQKVSKEFQTKYYRVIEKKSGAKVSHDAPSATGNLTYEEWLKLPVNEMKKRYSEIIQQEKNKGV